MRGMLSGDGDASALCSNNWRGAGRFAQRGAQDFTELVSMRHLVPHLAHWRTTSRYSLQVLGEPLEGSESAKQRCSMRTLQQELEGYRSIRAVRRSGLHNIGPHEAPGAPHRALADYLAVLTAEYLVNLFRAPRAPSSAVGSCEVGQGELLGISGQM